MSRSAYQLDSPRAVDWRDWAACAGHDPDMWTLGEPGNDRAVMICHGCPVQAECHGEAIRDPDAHEGTIMAGYAIRRGGPKRLLHVCEHCARPYVSWSTVMRYCGDSCARAAKYRRRVLRERFPYTAEELATELRRRPRWLDEPGEIERRRRVLEAGWPDQAVA